MKYRQWQDMVAAPESLSESECHVWLWNLSVMDIEMDLRTLSSEEIAVARSFVFEEDKAKYILCHRMLRCLLSTYLQCSPKEIEMVASDLGKPLLTGQFSELHFSLSHTSSHAILAIAHSPVGADVEQVRPIEEAVAEAHFSINEQKQLAAYTGEDWMQGFFRCWTRKEALLKAEGVGLNIQMGSFDVEIAHDKAPALLQHRVNACFTREWRLHDISFSHEIIAAVAVDPSVQELMLFTISSTLAE